MRVSMLGMGTGGPDPLGQKSGRSETEMIGLLHRAFDLGVNLFWNAERLRDVLANLAARGLVHRPATEDADPLGWLVEDGVAGSLVEAAYRFAAYTPGVTSVMCGTLDVGDLEQDAAFLDQGALPSHAVSRLRETFRHVAEPIGN